MHLLSLGRQANLINLKRNLIRYIGQRGPGYFLRQNGDVIYWTIEDGVKAVL